jgi:hypothetical protein
LLFKDIYISISISWIIRVHIGPFVGNSERKKPLGISRHRDEDTAKMGLIGTVR